MAKAKRTGEGDRHLLSTKRASPPRELTTRTLQVRTATVDEKSRSVEAVLATEHPTTVFDFNRWEAIDEVLVAAGVTLPQQTVLLEAHHRETLDEVLGSIREMRREGNRIVGRLVFAEGDERADGAWNKIRQGHITDVSVGYRADEFADLEPGSTTEINGQAYTAGSRMLRVTTKWTLREVSVVPIGADEFAKMRGENQNRHTNQAGSSDRQSSIKEKNMDPFEKWLRKRGIDPATLDDSKRAELKTEFDAETTRAELDTGPANGEPSATLDPPPQPADPQRATPADHAAGAAGVDAVRAEAQRAERTRIAAIHEMVRGDVPDAIVQRAIDDGWTAERAAQAFLTAINDSRPEPVPAGTPGIHVRDHGRDCNERTLAAGLRMRCGLTVIDPNASDARRAEQERLADQGQRYSDMSLIDVCRESLRLAGQRIPLGRAETIRAAVSTNGMTNIFTDSVNAAIVQGFEEAGDPTAGLVREADVADFKTNTDIQLGKSAGLRQLPRGKAAEHASRADSTETYKIHRYAEQVAIDEQDLIDDNVGALTDWPRELGQEAGRVRPDLVISLLLANPTLNADSVAVFHADHANLGTSSTALATATLQAGITAMRKQRQDDRPLNIAPKFLLVPADLEFTAAILLKSADRTNASGGFNPLKGLNIDIRADDRLGVAGVTDPRDQTARVGTATNWFLVGDPQRGPAIKVAYLAGTGRRPVLRPYVLDRGQFGLGWDVKFDFGAAIMDYRGLYKATGAAS